MTIPEKHSGRLRPRITIEAADRLRIEWCVAQTLTRDVETRVVWTETITIPEEGWAVVPRVACIGEWSTDAPFFQDQDGYRHFRMHADPKHFNATLGAVHASLGKASDSG